jgi:hypothetical protein
MRRSTALSSVLTIGMLGFVPGVLAKQDATPIPDPAPSFEDIIVTCDGQACRPVDGMQTYNVEFNAAAYVPEKTYDEAIVVLVLEGQLAFRVQTGDVIFDPVGIGGPGASNAVKILKTDITVPFGGTPSTALTQPQYQDLGGTMTDAECSRPPLTNLCRLDPAKFADQQTFVLLEKDDIVYLPAGSSCFICNTTDVTHGDPSSGSPARALVWAPGPSGPQGESGFSWYVGSKADNPDGLSATPSARKSGQIVDWMFNPGSRCN